MTNIEQEFFKVFGIEPKYQDACTVEDKYWQNEELANKYGTFDMYMNAKCGNQENCTTQCSCAYTKEIYPEITAEKLLELVYIIGVKLYGFLYLNGTYSTNINSKTDIILVEADDFREGILTLAIQPRVALRIKKQVRALFEGNNNEF